MASVAHLIRDHALTALGNISTANGYQTTAVVNKPHKSKAAETATHAINYVGVKQRKRGATANGQHIDVEADYVFELIVRQKPATLGAPYVLDDETEKLISDVERALMADQTRGGRAIYSWVSETDERADDGALDWHTTRLAYTVQFRHSRTNPEA